MTILRRLGITLTLLAAALCGSLVLGELHASYAPPDLYGVCNGRLTLTSGVPVTTSDVTAATSVKFTPINGNRCPAYVSGQWMPRTFAELSIAVPATTSSVYDVFLYDNAGTLALELSAAWTSDTARFGAGTYATLLPTQDGVYVKSTNGTAIDATRRYLGSFRTTTVSGQTEDSLTKRYVSNYYNRVLRPVRRLETTASWNYSSNTIRQANAAAANQIDVVQGVAEGGIDLLAQSSFSDSTLTAWGWTGIGEDSTSAVSTSCSHSLTNVMVANSTVTMQANLRTVPAVGRHTYVWLERTSGDATGTFNGVSASGIQSGLTGMWAN